MDDRIQIFKNEHFEKVRVILINGEPWFVGKDVANNLGYANPQKAIRDHVDDDDKMVNESFTLGQGSSPLLINESGMYALVFGSKLPRAKEFKHWVTYEVLPSIRKTGSYTLPSVATAPVPARKNRRPLSPTARVYAFLMSNNTVKIGHSDNVNKRKANLKSKYKLTVQEIHQTSFIPREIARSIEKACQEIFSSYKLGGEFFSVDFEAACKVIDIFVEFVDELPLISKFERGDKLLTIADKLESSPERKTVLINAAIIFVGKNLE